MPRPSIFALNFTKNLPSDPWKYLPFCPLWPTAAAPNSHISRHSSSAARCVSPVRWPFQPQFAIWKRSSFPTHLIQCVPSMAFFNDGAFHGPICWTHNRLVNCSPPRLHDEDQISIHLREKGSWVDLTDHNWCYSLTAICKSWDPIICNFHLFSTRLTRELWELIF